MYWDSVSSFATVKFPAAEFKRGYTSLEEDEHSRCPKTATNDDDMANVLQMVRDNRHIK
ncbi:hypothetical protein NPIL_668231, partial [Nephila pilipes]